jgi:hypothetical protein
VTVLVETTSVGTVTVLVVVVGAQLVVRVVVDGWFWVAVTVTVNGMSDVTVTAEGFVGTAGAVVVRMGDTAAGVVVTTVVVGPKSSIEVPGMIGTVTTVSVEVGG